MPSNSGNPAASSKLAVHTSSSIVAPSNATWSAAFTAAFFNLHHCIATTRAKQKRTATPPRKRLSRPMTSIANGGKRRRTSTSADRTARQSKSNGSSAINPDRTVRQLGSNSSSAQINQFLIYALRTLTSIGARSAHAIKFIGKQTKRRKTHGKRYHKRRKQNREFHGRPLSANAKPLSPTRYERSSPLFASAGKAQSIGIIMSHERKTHAKRRSKMKFNF